MSQSVYLDTHAVIWLFAGRQFPEIVKVLLESHDIFICPIVELELQYLFEIKRINYCAREIIEDLNLKIDLKIDDLPFDTIIKKASEIQWTRDSFDRIIAAATIVRDYPLITKDAYMLSNLRQAIWNNPK